MDWSNLAGALARIGLTGLGTAFGGPLGGTIGGALGGAIASALGTDPTPEAVQQAIEANPDAAAAKLRDLEDARQSELAMYQAQLGDVADARRQTVQLVQAGSSMAWGPAIVTVFVLATFTMVMGATVWRGIPAGETAVIVGLIETLKVLSVACVSYWVGSSSGSKRNGDALRDALAGANARPSIGQIAGKALDAAMRPAKRAG